MPTFIFHIKRPFVKWVVFFKPGMPGVVVQILEHIIKHFVKLPPGEIRDAEKFLSLPRLICHEYFEDDIPVAYPWMAETPVIRNITNTKNTTIKLEAIQATHYPCFFCLG